MDMWALIYVCVCVYLELHVCSHHTVRWPRFKVLCADRGSSHNMNHLVTTAELEMSHFISVPHAWLPLNLWQWSWREDLIKERSWDFKCKQTFIALGSSVVHFPHNNICSTVALNEIIVCCATVWARCLIRTKCAFQILDGIICPSFCPGLSPSISDLYKEWDATSSQWKMLTFPSLTAR